MGNYTKIYTVEILLNRREDMRFFMDGHQAGDPVESVGKFRFQAPCNADTLEIAEVVFRFGNLRDITDIDKTEYPQERSISVGDVLVITDEAGTEQVLRCASFGWKPAELPLTTV